MKDSLGPYHRRQALVLAALNRSVLSPVPYGASVCLGNITFQQKVERSALLLCHRDTTRLPDSNCSAQNSHISEDGTSEKRA
jgi:hypothetical protein